MVKTKTETKAKARVELMTSTIMVCAVAMMALLILTSLKIGPVPMSWTSLLSLLTEGQLAFDAKRPEAQIIWSLRLPRVLMALLVGAVLALSGAALQGLLRNPLASPSLIGISSGAALAAATMIVLKQQLLFYFSFEKQIWLVPAGAFAGSLICSLWVVSASKQGGRTDTGLLLLSGVAMTSLCGAGTGLMSFFADDAQLRNFTYWSLGSVAGADWQQLATVLLFSLPALVSLPLMGRTLNALLLGENEAQYLGVPLESRKLWMIVIISMAVGSAVAFTGVIGFVGLIVPHLLRLVLGSDHRRLLPTSCLVGACLLAASDLMARTLISPIELPLGVVTAAVGSPYFIYLLAHYRRSLAL